MTYYPTYALITHFVTLIAILSIRYHYKVRTIFYFFIASLITFFISFLILTDYGIYDAVYQNINLDAPIQDSFWIIGENPSPYEPLYVVLTYVARLFSENYNYIRVFMVLLALLIKIVFLLRWGSFYSIAFVFYISILFYPDSYLLRASLSASFLLLATWSIFDNKSFISFLFFVLLAAGFHISALVFIPFWFIRNIKLSTKTYYVILFFILLTSFYEIGLPLVNVFITMFAGSENALLFQKLIMYSNSEDLVNNSGYGFSSIIYFSIALATIAFKKTLVSIMPNYHFVLIMILFSLLMLQGFSDIPVIGERLFRMTSFFLVIAFGYLLNVLNKHDKLLISTLIIVILNIIPYITDAGPFILL